jgi:hypothetical protein
MSSSPGVSGWERINDFKEYYKSNSLGSVVLAAISLQNLPEAD